MKLERTKNTVRNMIWGVSYQAINIILPFIARTVFIYILGEEYLGLNSLFTSILGVLNISELGFASAIVYNLYEAIANDDTTEFCALMNFYKKCYRVVGIFVLASGSCLFPFLKYFIKGEVPANINIYAIYAINLISTCSAYFMFAYKNSVLIAFQRVDLDRKILIPLDVIKYIIQIVLLIQLKNYYIYIAILPIFSIITNIVKAKIVDKYYPQYKPDGKLKRETLNKIIANVKALFISKIGGTLSLSFDSIVISMCIGLTYLGKYQNYTCIVSSVVGFIQLLFDSLKSGWGNSLKTETIERNLEIFKELTFINNWIICVCAACFMCLFQPFINLWVGENYLLSIDVVILVVINFWITRYQYVMFTFKDAAGLWKQDQYRPLIVGITNLIGNLILASKIGLAGVLLSTILTSILISYPWVIYNVFVLFFKISPIPFVIDTIVSFCKAIVVVVLTYRITMIISVGGWFGFIIKAVVCGCTSCILLFGMNFYKKECRQIFERIKMFAIRKN